MKEIFRYRTTRALGENPVTRIISTGFEHHTLSERKGYLRRRNDYSSKDSHSVDITEHCFKGKAVLNFDFDIEQLLAFFNNKETLKECLKLDTRPHYCEMKENYLVSEFGTNYKIEDSIVLHSGLAVLDLRNRHTPFTSRTSNEFVLWLTENYRCNDLYNEVVKQEMALDNNTYEVVFLLK